MSIYTIKPYFKGDVVMKRINILLLCTFLCPAVLSLSGFMIQQIPDKEERISAINDFRQQFGDEMKVRVRPETGIPASIHGQRITKYRGTPEQIARAFITEEKTMFGIRDPQRDIEVVKSVYSEKLGTIITFEQRYNSIPVLYSCYIIGVDNDGSIYCINGRYFPDVQLDTNPNITAVQASAVVENDLSGKTFRFLKNRS